MKISNFFLIVLFFMFLLSSCNKDEPNDMEQELFNKVIGRWAIVSIHEVGYWGSELLHDDYFHISDSIHWPNFARAMHFWDDGEIVIESSLEGITSMEDYFATWGVEENEIIFKHCLFPNEIETTIYELSETEFYYKIYFEWQSSDSLMQEMHEYELSR